MRPAGRRSERQRRNRGSEFPTVRALIAEVVDATVTGPEQLRCLNANRHKCKSALRNPMPQQSTSAKIAARSSRGTRPDEALLGIVSWFSKYFRSASRASPRDHLYNAAGSELGPRNSPGSVAGPPFCKRQKDISGRILHRSIVGQISGSHGELSLEPTPSRLGPHCPLSGNPEREAHSAHSEIRTVGRARC